VKNLHIVEHSVFPTGCYAVSTGISCNVWGGSSLSWCQQVGGQYANVSSWSEMAYDSFEKQFISL